MKIAYIITAVDHYGGAQVHIKDITQWMRDRGHNVTVMAGSPGIVSDTLLAHDIPFREIPSLKRFIHPWQDLRAFFQTRRILKSIKPDIVSCHSSKAGIIGRLAAWSLGIPGVFTAHGWAFTEGISSRKRQFYAVIERLCAMISAHIITVSQYDKFLALDRQITRARNITVIHNGMPYRDASVKFHANKTPQLVMVARFAAPKDHTTLLNALGMITDQPWHLNLIGAGDDTIYRAITKSLNIEHRVTFHGQRTDIDDYLPTQDIFLLISDWEGFPRSIIEAMRASLPVITTRVGGCAESVSQFQNGYVIPKQDALTLARIIKKLINDPKLAQSMGQIGRTRFERYFTFDHMANQTLRVYESVLATKRSRRHAMQAPPHQTSWPLEYQPPSVMK